VDRLSADGVEVVRAVHDRGTDDGRRFDYADPGTWESALDGVDRVFLMRPPAISEITRVMGPFIELMPRRGVRHVVVLSVMGVNPVLPHWRLERAVRSTGLGWTMVRPAYFMQNLETAHRADIRDRDRIRLPAGHGKTSFVDTRDVADVVALASQYPHQHAGHAYTLTGAEALGWGAVASLLSAEVGRPVVYEPVGLLGARRELRAAGLPRDYVNVQLMINTIARLGLADSVNQEIRGLLGKPPRRLVDYIAEHRDQWTA